MGIPFRKVSKEEMAQEEQNRPRPVDGPPGVSTEPGGSYMDKVQTEIQKTGQGPGGEKMSESEGVKVELDSSYELDPEVDQEPKQVKPEKVVFVPTQDFDGRINQTDFEFVKGRRVEVTREEANTWVEADKGWIQE